ncbi:MAG: F0F1 ATP synthase subunit B [Bacteroidota bacterium]
MLSINPGLILWTIITFVLVLAVLRRLAWKPLLAALAAREERIRTALREAEEAQQEARRLLEEHREARARADEESHRIIREGRAVAEKLKGDLVEKAEASARRMMDQAREEIRREKEVALAQLRAEVADLAVGAASKILDARLDPAAQKSLVEQAIREMGKG